MNDPPAPSSRRSRDTRRGVVVAERIARCAITTGGIGTIVAVSSIFVFLAWVVLPLFERPTVEALQVLGGSSLTQAAQRTAVDHEMHLMWSWLADGSLEVLDARDGEVIARPTPFGDRPPTAVGFQPGLDDVAFGYADGTFALGRIGFEDSFLDSDAATSELEALELFESTRFRDGVVQRTGAGLLRLTTLGVELGEAHDTEVAAPVVGIDVSIAPTGTYVVTRHADGTIILVRVREREDFMTGEVVFDVARTDLTGVAPDDHAGARWIYVSGLGQHVYLGWSDGRVAHFDVRQFGAPRLLETTRVVEPGRELVELQFLNGKLTLCAGDDAGAVGIWFAVRDEASEEGDQPLVHVHELEPGGARVTALAPSPRRRLLAVGFADGALHLYQATSGELLLRTSGPSAARALVVAPKEDALLARIDEGLVRWDIDPLHPEATLTSLFTPVWYEGFPEAVHSWQATSASDDFEPKFGLMPLIFGTIKGTLYSMLFGAPLAILAAIFTSEFLATRLRTTIKSTVELMASLPSVVLGFIAGLVIAPFVEALLPAVLAGMLAVPLALLVGAHLWQLVPQERALRWSGWPRLLCIALCLPIGCASAMLCGPLLEWALFSGDMGAWLDGQQGSAFGGWFYLLLPAAALVTAFGMATTRPRFLAKTVVLERRVVAGRSMLRFGVGLAATLAIAGAVALALQVGGLDARGGPYGTHVQRNALVVGFAMGFAIIPIIYTLSEDALSEVPRHLREGSLGAGATRWQTATRIVIPFAMSGLFSAMMIGLGRAVGETMIVLMAAGNTPIMEWNAFNGFRTLSANIAVEMPEAVRNSTHYRTLFLAALVLFGMTFVLNTCAEFVRRHFRRRTQAL
jgi:phosphate transport system permease protein